MNERIRQLRKSLGLTLEEFGSKVGVGKTAISNIEMVIETLPTRCS